MHHVYFIFAGYRVAIGKSSRLYNRLTSYHRTHYQVEVLGLIPCESPNHALKVERECLKRFKDSNAFRDMFYLSPEMKDWIVENTKPYIATEHPNNYYSEQIKTPETQQRLRKRNREAKRRQRKDPDFRKRESEYRKDPKVQERERQYLREYHARKKKKAQRDAGQLTLFD